MGDAIFQVFLLRDHKLMSKNCIQLITLATPPHILIVWCRISTRKDSLGLQEDLNKLISWPQTWLLRFHPEKCKVTHIGHQINTEYKIEDSGNTVQLMTIKEEKDLGIYIVDNLKPSL